MGLVFAATESQMLIERMYEIRKLARYFRMERGCNIVVPGKKLSRLV